MKTKRWLSILLCFALVISLLPTTVIAEGNEPEITPSADAEVHTEGGTAPVPETEPTENLPETTEVSTQPTEEPTAVEALSVPEGNENTPETLADTGAFTVTGGTYGTDYKYENNTLTILSGTGLTISGATITDRIWVENGVCANLTLDGVNIDFSSEGYVGHSPVDFSNAGESSLHFQGTNTLKASGNAPAVYVPDGNRITIGGDGILNAYGGDAWPGIGRMDTANILIESGTVNAYGGDRATGIGGSWGHAGGNVAITGGIITAVGNNADDIGGGYDYENQGRVTVDGDAVVYANQISTDQQLTRGIVIQNGNATVYGDVTLPGDLTIESGETLTVPSGATLTVPFGKILTISDGATLINEGTIYLEGMLMGVDPATVGGTIFEHSTICGAFKVFGEDDKFSYAGGVLTILDGAGVIISNADPATATTDCIEVASGATANITLAGVNIDVSAQSGVAAFKIADGSTGNVTVNLAKGAVNTLKSGTYFAAGLQKNGGASSGKLTINGPGSLYTSGTTGIGSIDCNDACNIIITGGVITAFSSSEYGVGIGAHGETSGSCDVTISGGTVTATGGWHGAGIGSAYDGKVTITGGTVTALGGHFDWNDDYSGVGIGGFFDEAIVNISGGTVKATGHNGTGIGSCLSQGVVTISGGTVEAIGDDDGAGIGGEGGTVTITGGTVTATGGSSEYGSQGGAGIGGNGDSSSGSVAVTISGGTVTAAGGTNAADIGDGSGGSGSTFSTGTGGSAFIVASSISDQRGKENGSWSGVIVEGDAGEVYGSTVTLSANAELEAGKTLIVPEGKTLTVGAGATLTNNGTIYVNGTMNLGAPTYGTVIGSGKIIGTVNFGDFNVTGDIGKVSYGGNTLTILDGATVTIMMKDGVTQTTTDCIEVADGASANITLSGVDIDMSANYGVAAFRIADHSSGNVTVNLADGTTNTLKSGEYNAGLQMNSNTGSLTINGPGTLDATGGNFAAGIGGGEMGEGCAITINGGTVKATGGERGVGIGGGRMSTSITINGGAVEAFGGRDGAGIGGGEWGECTITINSGTVKATGGEYGAGIGGGRESRSASITITGGAVEAFGGRDASGISGGEMGECTITINSGTVKATGSEYGVGIGSSHSHMGNTITITGGTVKATGGEYSAGISGGDGPMGSVTITGGTVEAIGSRDSAGIDGVFSTTKDGTAGNSFIVASSISDQSGKENGSWSGAIVEGDAGEVYGSAVTLTTDATLPEGKTLTVPEGKTLTIGVGKTLTNNGTIDVNGTLYYGEPTYGTITGDGSIIGSGQIISTFILGDFKVTGDINKVSYANNTLTILNGADVSITMKDGITTTINDRILVASGATANITLAGVSIDMSGEIDATAFMIEGSSASTTVTLEAGTTNILKSGENCAGLGVKTGSTLTIKGDGALESTGGKTGAGIGGGFTYNAGTINIESGTITATGGYDGAGIGGGHANEGEGFQYGLFDNIHITGGVIIAHSPGNAAAIGTGCWGKTCPGSIIIENAQVTATTNNPTPMPPNRCAAIGRAYSNDYYDYDCVVKITNSIVSAQNVGRGNTISGENGTPDIQNSIVKVNAGSNHNNAYAVYGSYILSKPWTLPEGTTLFIDRDSSLTVNSGVTLTNNGAIYVDGTLNGTVAGSVYYPLTVTGGEASPISTQNNKTYANAGETITLTAVSAAPVGQAVKWICNGVTLSGNTFPMPSEAVTVTAEGYRNAPTYTVTIPASVEVGATAKVEASGVNVVSGSTLTVTIDSGTSFTMTSGEGATLDYAVHADNKNGALLSKGDAILQIAGGQKNDAASAVLAFTLASGEEETYSGVYQGTITFTISIN